MRRFPFLLSKHALALILVFNLVILGISIYLGVISAGQMRQIVKDDFNQQQLVLARHTASLMEQDSDFLERELSTLNVSPSIQYLEKLTWANRMRATLSSVREEGVVQIQRLDREGPGPTWWTSATLTTSLPAPSRILPKWPGPASRKIRGGYTSARYRLRSPIMSAG